MILTRTSARMMRSASFRLSLRISMTHRFQRLQPYKYTRPTRRRIISDESWESNTTGFYSGFDISFVKSISENRTSTSVSVFTTNNFAQMCFGFGSNLREEEIEK